MRPDELMVRPGVMRQQAAALRAATARTLERVSEVRQQRIIDVEVRAAGLALLRQVRARCGSEASVLFDTEFRTIADEATAVEAIVRAAGDIADCCDLRLWDDRAAALRIRAHQGFAPDFLAAFRSVTPDDPSTYAVALATGRPVRVDDVTRSPIFAGQAGLDVLLDAGSRSVASYPLLATDRTVFGVLSFHRRTPDPSCNDLDALVAHGAAALLTYIHERSALPRS